MGRQMPGDSNQFGLEFYALGVDSYYTTWKFQTKWKNQTVTQKMYWDQQRQKFMEPVDTCPNAWVVITFHPVTFYLDTIKQNPLLLIY